MSMTFTIPPNLERRLNEQASRVGLRPDEYATSLIERGLAEAVPDQTTLDLLASWEAEDETDDPAELARRQAEFEEFKEAMNRSKRDMEGPNARIPFP